jgi:septal ring factor EnvC (AmiA/AmiB activator)
MESGEIIKLMGLAAVGTLGGGGLIGLAIKLLIPIFAKARLDANSLGSASLLIDDLRAEKKQLQDDVAAERKRADDEIRVERERAEALRKTLEDAFKQLYEVREELSNLKNENISLIGKVEVLQQQVTALRRGNDA